MSSLLLPKQIGGRSFGMYAWYIVTAGLDASGNPQALRVDSNGSIAPAAPNTNSSLSPSRFANRGVNATLNVKASAGNVFSLTCFNANAASRYIQLHNTATTPANAAVPLYSFLVPTGSMTIIGTDFFTANGANFSTGIAFAFSTTQDTYTAGTAADQSTVIHFA